LIPGSAQRTSPKVQTPASHLPAPPPKGNNGGRGGGGGRRGGPSVEEEQYRLRLLPGIPLRLHQGSVAPSAQSPSPTSLPSSAPRFSRISSRHRGRALTGVRHGAAVDWLGSLIDRGCLLLVVRGVLSAGGRSASTGTARARASASGAAGTGSRPTASTRAAPSATP
jgi:hypothetical protein